MVCDLMKIASTMVTSQFRAVFRRNITICIIQWALKFHNLWIIYAFSVTFSDEKEKRHLFATSSHAFHFCFARTKISHAKQFTTFKTFYG